MTTILMVFLAVVLQLGLNLYATKKNFGFSKRNQIYAVIANAGVSFMFLAKYGYSTNILILCLASSILVSTFFVDLKHYIIPNEYNAALFLLAIWFAWNNSAHLEVFLKGGAYFLIAFFILHVVSRGQLGMGDVKMSVSIGMLLGSGFFLNYMITTFLTGAFVGIIMMVLKKRQLNGKIPFGPFMVFAFFYLTLF